MSASCSAFALTPHDKAPGIGFKQPEYQQAGTKDDSRQSASDQRGTSDLPLFVKTLPPDKTEEEASNEARDRDEKHFNDKATLVIATGTMFVLIVQTVVFGIQARRLKQTIEAMRDVGKAQSYDMAKSIDIAKRSADAAFKAAEASEKQVFAAIASQLPILRYEPPELLRYITDVDYSGPYSATTVIGRPEFSTFISGVNVSNVGNTQADLEFAYFGWSINDFEANPIFGHTVYNLRPVDAHSQGRIDCGRFEIILGIEAVKKIQGKGVLNIYIRVEYVDFVGAWWKETATWKWDRQAPHGAYSFLRNYDAPQQYNERKRMWQPGDAERDKPTHTARSS